MRHGEPDVKWRRQTRIHAVSCATRKISGSNEPGSADHPTRCVLEGTKWTSVRRKKISYRETWVFYNDVCNFGCVGALLTKACPRHFSSCVTASFTCESNSVCLRCRWQTQYLAGKPCDGIIWVSIWVSLPGLGAEKLLRHVVSLAVCQWLRTLFRHTKYVFLRPSTSTVWKKYR